MTNEELAAAGLPLDPVAEGAEHAAPAEDSGSPRGSRSRGDGEVQSDGGEDLGGVDAGVDDLVMSGTALGVPLNDGESSLNPGIKTR
jgi:hypothetical protein